jgi:curved DNA-binding protein CbpA
MDIYKVLKVPVDAKQIEIDRAYQKLVKEAQYDSSIQVKEVEIAYRILSDSAQRAIYDSKKGIVKAPVKGFKGVKAALTKKKGKKGFADHRQREKNLQMVAIVLFAIGLIYYLVRFGYNLKSFDPGNKIYFKESNVLFGTLVKAEDDHKFSSGISDAYQVRLPSEEVVWFPASDVKILCYGKKDK